MGVLEVTGGDRQIYNQKTAKRKNSEENKKQLRGEPRGRGPQSRHAPPSTSTGREKDTGPHNALMTQEVKYRSFGSVKCSISTGSTVGRYAIAGRKQQPTRTRGIQQSLKSMVKKP